MSPNWFGFTHFSWVIWNTNFFVALYVEFLKTKHFWLLWLKRWEAQKQTMNTFSLQDAEKASLQWRPILLEKLEVARFKKFRGHRRILSGLSEVFQLLVGHIRSFQIGWREFVEEVLIGERDLFFAVLTEKGCDDFFEDQLLLLSKALTFVVVQFALLQLV